MQRVAGTLRWVVVAVAVVAAITVSHRAGACPGPEVCNGKDDDGDGLIDDPVEQAAQLPRQDPRVLDLAIVAIQCAREFAHDPIRRQLRMRRA